VTRSRVRPSRRREKTGRQNRGDGGGFKWPAIALASTIFVGLIGVFVFDSLNAPVPSNRLTGCPNNEADIPLHVTILFDTSEPLAESQQLAVRNTLNNLINNEDEFPEYSKLSVYRVDSDLTSGIQQVSLNFGNSSQNGNSITSFCRPATNWQQSTLAKQMAEKLSSYYAGELLGAVGNNSEKYSPIIDALRYLGSSLIGPSTTQNRVIVVSDLIENSSILTMYESDWYKKFNNNQSFVIDQRPIFPAGTSIEAYVIARPRYGIQSLAPSSDFVEFWRQVLTSDRRADLTMELVSGRG
jgi:hypothetical protein